MLLDEFSRMLENLLVAISAEVIAVYFNYDLSKVSLIKLLYHMVGYTQVENELTHLSESQIDHVYIKSTLLEEFHTKTTDKNMYFSDHDAV